MRLPSVRTTPPTTQSAPFAAPESQLVVHVEAPLKTIAVELEQRVQKRLAEGHFGIGPGGTVNYRVERGPLSLSVTSSSLVIEAPVSGHAEACRGERCYASCEPQAVVQASVPLLLRPDYRFEPSAISLKLTRGCKVRALGGLLTIDVTPTLESELQSELAKAARQIDRHLPNPRAEVERAWTQLAMPRPLPLGGCLLLQPSALVQGALTPSTKTLRVNLAVLATPELRSQCTNPAPPQPLPALTRDLTLPEEGAVLLGMVTPLEGFERSLLAATPVHASQRTLQIAGARVAARASEVDITFDLGGDVCGSTTIGATPEFSTDGAHITLGRATLSSDEQQRWQESQVDAPAIAKSLIASAHVAPLLSPSAFRTAAPPLAKALSTRSLQVSADISSSRPAGAAARDHDLIAWLEARGSLTLRTSAPASSGSP